MRNVTNIYRNFYFISIFKPDADAGYDKDEVFENINYASCYYPPEINTHPFDSQFQKILIIELYDT